MTVFGMRLSGRIKKRRLTVCQVPHSRTAENGGFTLLETLLTVAILVILLGLSIVGVARYKDHLKITELDNAARDIYMAAENRAVLLQSSGAASSLISLSASPTADELTPVDAPVKLSDGTESTVACLMLSEKTKVEILNDLLPVGVIDPTLRDGNFYILYDRGTYHVYEVFYAEGEIDKSKLDNFRKTRGERVSEYRKKDTDRLVGHYAGGLADNIGTKYLPQPGVEVIITNSEELTLTVKFTIPDNLPVGVAVDRTPYVRLEYGGRNFVLMGTKGADEYDAADEYRIKNTSDIDDAEAGKTVAYTCVLDSLEKSGDNFTKQFKNLFGSSTPKLGDDFKVAASLKLSAEGYLEHEAWADDTNNSLFAEGSTYGSDGTALIENLRHLQNLHSDHSNVGPGTVNAKQISDIDCANSLKNEKDIDGKNKVLDGNYKFIPIVNDNLTSYNGYSGENYHIHNLSTITTANDAGLFGKVSNNLTIENTRVCWDDPKKLVTPETNPTDYVYAVSGTNAGGLIGSVSSGGDVTIKNSFAATTVKGETNVGGLIGIVENGGTVTIENSYADCYLSAPTNNTNTNAGGLIGSNSGNVTLKNCYAAGFIVDPPDKANTAGLVCDTVTSAQNTYSVVRVINKKDENGKKITKLGQPEYPLYVEAGGTEPAEDDETNHVYYLYRAGEIEASKFGDAFESGDDKPDTHPYDLRYKLSSPTDESLELKDKTYPFPGIKNLPHYCDWADLDVAGLAYYEYYDTVTLSESYGMATVYERADSKANKKKGDSLEILLQEDTDNPDVLKDGYALVFKKGAKIDLKNGFTVEYGGLNNSNSKQVWTLKKQSPTNSDTSVDVIDGLILRWTKEGASANEAQDVESFQIVDNKTNDTYILVPLPDEVVTGELADSGSFYQKIECGSAAKTFFFNPHFAKSVKLPVEKYKNGASIPADQRPKAPDNPTANPNDPDNHAIVRTPRHLYDLSRTYTYGTETKNYYSEGYYFEQELDLDYSTYVGYTKSDPNPNIDFFAPKNDTLPFKQVPIGPLDESNQYFMGTYDGGCHIIENVFFEPIGDIAGLFGSTGDGKGTPGNLKDIVYKLDPDLTKTESIAGDFRAAGALVGKNYGTVDNCAVYGVNMNVTGKYIGGLVGYNQNTVTNCAAELANLNTTPTTAAGGLVGGQSGTISNSYAVGKLTGSGKIAGLLGNGGNIKNSYAAVDLAGSTERYGLCDGTAVNSGWLKDVYVYRGVKYNITSTSDYKGGYAVTFTTLKGGLTQSDAKNTVQNIPDTEEDNKYRTTYEDKSFPYLTGVTGLDRNQDGKIKPTSNSSNNPIHYGLWPTPLPVGLTYYEQDGNSYTAEGFYEDVKIDTLGSNPVKDGYALVFKGTNNDIPLGDYAVKYGNSDAQSWTLTKSDAGYIWKLGATTTQQVDSVTTTDYTLIPLPDTVVTGELPGGDDKDAKFYQKLVYGEGLDSERTFYFNPHFAKTVNAGTVALVNGKTEYKEPTNPAGPTNSALNTSVNGYTVFTFPHSKIDEQWKNTISVRTPRHLYDLSRFQKTYVVEPSSGTKLYYFKQELDLDYNLYGWYGDNTPTKKNGKTYYEQDPIGRDADGGNWSEGGGQGLQGGYNGNGHWIRNVFYHTNAAALTANGNYDPQSEYIGLFRYVEYPFNIKYEVPNVGTIDAGALSTNMEFRMGTLLGGAFRAANCTVTLGSMTVTSSKASTTLCVGGLLGYTNTADDCHVTISGTLTVKGTGSSNSTTVYTGGLIGRLRNLARNCTSEVGAIDVQGGNNVYAGGLTGYSSIANKNEFRKISNSYAVIGTMNVKAGSENVYAGGLTGWCDRIDHSTAVVPGGLTINRSGTSSLSTTGAFGGGLAGGANDIRSCAAIAAFVNVTGSGSARYAGGLVGVLKTRWTTGDPQPPRDGTGINDSWGFRVNNSYAAVAKLTAYSNNTIGALCGYRVNSPNAAGTATIAPTISGCYYLGGNANAWHFGTTNFAGMNNAGGGTARTYTQLQSSTNITDMGKAQNNAYPFPIPTKKDGNWYYPGNIWPESGSATNTASEVSEPEDESFAPEAEPNEPDAEPEMGEEDSEEESESGRTPAP